MANKLVEYRLRVRNAANSADALEVTSVRGGTNPYLSSVPSGDGASFDPITGIVTSGSFSVRLVDPITSGTDRLFTSILEDSDDRQQLGHRRAFIQYREDGGSWTTLAAGRITRYKLVSDIEWDVTVGDFMQAEHEVTVFDRHPDPSEVDGLEPINDYLIRWPVRGALIGGPLLSNFRQVKNLGGWRFKVIDEGATWTLLEFVDGYDVNGRGISQVTPELYTAINDAAAPFFSVVPGAYMANSVLGSTDMQFGTFPDLAVLINGDAFTPTNGRYDDSPNVLETLGRADPAKILLGNPFVGRQGRGLLFIAGDLGETGLSLGVTYRVHVISTKVSTASPVYVTGHPVDIVQAVWDEAGIPWDNGAAVATRAALGSNAQVSLIITAAEKAGDFLERAIYGPFGIAARQGSDGELELFNSRIFPNTVPSIEIDEDDVVQGSTEAFDLDANQAIRSIVFEHRALIYAGPETYRIPLFGERVRPANSLAPFVERVIRYERSNADPGAIGSGVASFSVPGEVHVVDSTSFELAQWVDGRAFEIFDQRGRGPVGLRTTIIRGGAAMAAQIGDEILVNLPQLPNKNKRLIDDGSVPARAMQILHLTPTLEGHEIECIDSGPNANAISTLPTHTIAASTEAPRNIAELTITNASTLNSSGYAVRIQVAIAASGSGTPAASHYSDFAFYLPGMVPTGAIPLPSVFSDSQIYARARTEKTGERPSNWQTGVGVTLDAFDPPTGLTVTPDALDGSVALMEWTLGTDSAFSPLEIYLRPDPGTVDDDVLIATLPAGSTQYVLRDLTPGEDYTASVGHFSPATGDRSALDTDDFTADASVRTLNPPGTVDGFSFPRRIRRRVGWRIIEEDESRYGIIIVATEFPSTQEVHEAVEDSPGAGTYGAYAEAGKVDSVAGDWTEWSTTAPIDGLRRKLKSRQILEGATTSSFSAEVVVDPSVSDPKATFPILPGGVGTVEIEDGAVTRPKTDTRFRCRAFFTSSQSIPDDTETVLAFQTEEDDVGNMHDNASSNHRLTFPTGSDVHRWFIRGQVQFDANGTGDRLLILYYFNGSSILPLSFDARPAITWAIGGGFNLETTCTVTAMISAPAPGNYVYLAARQNSGGALNANEDFNLGGAVLAGYGTYIEAYHLF